MIFTITIFFTVRNVVLVVVTHAIAEGEAIVSSHKVDARRWASAVGVQCRTTTDALRKQSRVSVDSSDEVSDVITELTVPFSPSAVVRERANLIEPSGVPRLSDEFRVSQNGIIADCINQWWVL